MARVGTELIRFLYSTLIAFAFIITFAFLLDVFCLIFLGGLQDPLPLNWQMLFFKQWPILSGTISFFVHASFSYIICLTLAFGGMARVILGDSKIPLFGKDPESVA